VALGEWLKYADSLFEILSINPRYDQVLLFRLYSDSVVR
jgi:hypothetical protein